MALSNPWIVYPFGKLSKLAKGEAHGASAVATALWAVGYGRATCPWLQRTITLLLPINPGRDGARPSNA
jgi:hypothetical protein